MCSHLNVRPLATSQPSLSFSLSLIPLHPSLACCQCWIILPFYYSPEAAGADTSPPRSRLLFFFHFFFYPTLCFRSPGEKDTREEGAGAAGGKLPSQRGHIERTTPVLGKTCRCEWDNVELPTRQRLDRMDRRMKLQKKAWHIMNLQAIIGCGTQLRSKIAHSAFSH